MAKVKVFVGMFLALAAGCSESASDKNQQPATQGVIDVSSLPATLSEGDAFPPPAPELCPWALSVDALVWGRLLDVRGTNSPAANEGAGGWTWATSCPNGSSPALELEVAISRSLRGSLAGRVVARVGSSHRSMFVPTPVGGSGADMQWTPQSGPTRGPLLPGRPIGLPLHYLPSLGAWSVMGEAMFGLGADGHVFFQDRAGPLFEPAPKGAAGMTLDQLAALVTACNSADQTIAAAAAQRRDWVWSLWGPKGQFPSAYVAARGQEAP